MPERLSEILARRATHHRVPGASLAVVEADRLEHACFGVEALDRPSPVSIDTVFAVGSLGKSVFAGLVLALSDEGRLDLDQPVERLLPEHSLPDDPRAARITARHLLSHTSGLPNWRPNRWGPSPGPLVIEFEPGSRFGYSGEGYQLLQAVVERVCAERLDTVARQRLFEPLGMPSSDYAWSPDLVARLARGHRADDTPIADFGPARVEVLAAASLLSTGEDLARYLQSLLAPSGRAGTRAQWMQVKHAELSPGVGWGLGWGVALPASGSAAAFQWCSTLEASYKAWMSIRPDQGRGIVCLTNGHRGLGLCRDLDQLVFGDLNPAFDSLLLQ